MIFRFPEEVFDFEIFIQKNNGILSFMLDTANSARREK
jgi:hypothetical protein